VVTPFFSQGASSGDFNGDGWVDVVVLNDNGANYNYINDGTGNLVVQDLIDFTTIPASDNSGNYGSVYTDFDMDGDLDFYIAKCRQGVTNSNDPRRIDVLFVNDGQNYTQNAAQYGLADGHQTWTADFGDIDNDGDLDLFKTEHDVICQLFENIDNDTFIDITTQAGININGVGLQGMFRDFDNDGWQDIIISGDAVYFLHNDGDGTFTKEQLFGNIIFGTFALGDLNHDGFTDVYASRVIPFNNPDESKEDILYLSTDNGNHFLSLELSDTSKNISAIGAMATLYSALGIQIREVRGGEQYGVSNSHGMIFGLGKETTYDSLVIRWPDGTKERFNDLSIDRTWTLHRGGCSRTSETVWPPLVALCGNDSLVLKLEDKNISSWSNGSTADSIVVRDEGLYFATYIDDNDCPINIVPVEIIKDPDSIKPVITYDGNFELCNGEVALLSLPLANGYHWSSGQNTQTIEVTETGDYYASVLGYCLAQQSDTLSIDFLVPPTPETVGDTFKLGEDATLTAQGDSIVWYYDNGGVSVIGTGPNLVLSGLNSNATVYAQNLQPILGQDFQLGPVEQQGATKYNGAFVNGGLQFDVLDPVVLNEVTVYTDSAGARIIEISDGAGFFFDKQVDILAGKTVVQLDVDLPIGGYTISTNNDLNNLVFGNNSPYLWRSSEGIQYPYEINGEIAIKNSTFGEQFYYYFYDWKISTSDKYCGSALAPVTAVLDMNVGTEDIDDDHSFTITPNPTAGICDLKNDSSSSIAFEVVNVNGLHLANAEKIILEKNQYSLDLTNYPSGVYFIRIIRDGQMMTRKLIKL
jgi:hypothetical protein